MIYIWPYKLGSQSARSLANNLSCKRIGGEKRVKSYSHVINWGTARQVEILEQRTLNIINKPDAVNVARNKLSSFIALRAKGISVPEFTTDRYEASSWRDEETVVYARQMLEAHSGRGIVVVTADNDMVNAPLYVKGIPRSHEFRVHVGRGNIIDFAKKRRRDGSDNNNYIKNLSNGWVFCRDNVSLPGAVAFQAIKAVEALALDFGAVDVLYRERENEAWVLEVNTAPGLEGTTLQRYTQFFKTIIR